MNDRIGASYDRSAGTTIFGISQRAGTVPITAGRRCGIALEISQHKT